MNGVGAYVQYPSDGQKNEWVGYKVRSTRYISKFFLGHNHVTCSSSSGCFLSYIWSHWAKRLSSYWTDIEHLDVEFKGMYYISVFKPCLCRCLDGISANKFGTLMLLLLNRICMTSSDECSDKDHHIESVGMKPHSPEQEALFSPNRIVFAN